MRNRVGGSGKSGDIGGQTTKEKVIREIKHVLLFIAICVYIAFAAGHIIGLESIYRHQCYQCKLDGAVITKEDRAVMRYFGVLGMKVLNDERYIKYNGKWHHVVKGKYEGVRYSLVPVKDERGQHEKENDRRL